MPMKGVLLLGLIVFWTTVCNGEDGFLDDYRVDVPSKELAEDYLFLAEDEVECKEDADCSERQKCEELNNKKICQCADGLDGVNCENEVWCKKDGQFENCKDEFGTCEYNTEKRSIICTCGANKKLHPEENICKDTCSINDDCTNHQKCVEKNGWKTCQCADGLSGDDCEKNDWCEGKFKNCKNENGQCEYSVQERSVVCTCNTGQKLHPDENICKKTCSEDKDCLETQKCVEKNNWKSCQCADGLGGDNCKNEVWCDETGKFKKCKGENGTCEYNKEKRSVVCTCTDSGRKLHPYENRCRETCTVDTECQYGGKCTETDGGNKFCSCKLGLTGDKCQTVFDCSSTGKFKECETSGGNCKFDGSKAVCECSGNKKLHEVENKCKKCDCGPKGTCKFENGNKKCNCEEGFAVKNGKCTETCNDDDCEYGSECKDFGQSHFCECANGLSGDKCDIIIDCVANGKFEKCASGGGTCNYDEDKKKAECTCSDGKELNPKINSCQETCSSNDDCNGGECDGEEGKKFCTCKPELEGDKCKIVKDCKVGKYSECKKSGGDCGFDGTKSTCKCPDDKILDESLTKPICRTKCSSNKDCKNGGECKNSLCQCPDGTEGDDCSKITACETLKCEEKQAVCTYDSSKNIKTFCVCADKKYIFEETEKKCVAKWCKDGCNNAVSTCEYNDGVGVCKCKKEGTYYDYSTKSCVEMDPCFNMKCENDFVCRKGKCECPENQKKLNATTCEPKDFCNPNNKCFSGAKCEKGSSLGYVKCLCNSESKFYLPKDRKCDDGTCFLPVDRKTCSKTCPSGMTRKDGICTHTNEEKKCDQDCGFLGWCEKVDDKTHKCLCDPTYAEEDGTTKKCVLKASAVCPTKEKEGDNKCKCTGKYKQAANGITCELKSCSDEDVQNECKRKRAPKCVDNWKNDFGYKCVCPEGYIDAKDKGCIDPCSLDKSKEECLAKGQMCYIGQKLDNSDCRCPPTFFYDEKKKACDLGGESTFMIHSLPVLSKKYETVENNINKVLLNIDISISMKQAFRNLDFVHVLNFREDKAVLFCDVWLQFESNFPASFDASLEVRRWTYQLREINKELILLPGLYLSSNHIGGVKEEKMTLCTASVQQTVCGKGSICANNSCSCQTGFREIDSTIRASGDKRIVRCEDIDECAEAKHTCSSNSKCVNTPGSYLCKCEPGFKKAKGAADALDKEACIGLCDVNPCGKGTCQLTKEKTVDCTCPPGYTGSFCNRADIYLAKASKATKVVGAVLGTLLAIVIILIIVYIVKQRKNSYSEDFTPAPRNDNAEMVERRPMRGVTNRAYQ